MRWYVSGPMTGLPLLNFPAFHAAAAKLRAQGHEVINPAEMDAADAAPLVPAPRHCGAGEVRRDRAASGLAVQQGSASGASHCRAVGDDGDGGAHVTYAVRRFIDGKPAAEVAPPPKPKAAPRVFIPTAPAWETLCTCGVRYGMHRHGDLACFNQKWRPGNGEPQWLARKWERA